MTENNNTFKQVYRSTDDRPFEVWFAPKDATIAWPFIEDVPNTSLKAPKYDWKTTFGLKRIQPVKLIN